MKTQFAEFQSEVNGLRSQLQVVATQVLELRTEMERLTSVQQNVDIKTLVSTPPAEPSDPPTVDFEVIEAQPDITPDMEPHLEDMNTLSDNSVTLSDTEEVEEVEEGHTSAPPSPWVEPTVTATKTEETSSSLPLPTPVAAGDELPRPQLCEYLGFRPNSKTLKTLEDSGDLLSKHGWLRVRGAGRRGDPFIYRYDPQAIVAEELDISVYS